MNDLGNSKKAAGMLMLAGRGEQREKFELQCLRGCQGAGDA